MPGEQIEIDHNALFMKLKQVKSDADDNVARMLELLLLENQILSNQTSMGFFRGIAIELTSYPRFVQLVTQDTADMIGNGSNAQDEQADPI